MRFRSFIETFTYIGQCDRLRLNDPIAERNWHEMMANKKPISQEEFLSNVDMSRLLDSDETPAEYLANMGKVNFYSSVWGGRPAYFFESRGFEFIFAQQ